MVVTVWRVLRCLYLYNSHNTNILSIGVRILCSKIRELCYALTLTLFPYYSHPYLSIQCVYGSPVTAAITGVGGVSSRPPIIDLKGMDVAVQFKDSARRLGNAPILQETTVQSA